MGIKLPTLNFTLTKKEQLCIGIDIGSYAVKVCELAERGKSYKLLSLGSAKLPPGAVEDGALQDPAAVAAVITALLKNLQIKAKKVAISVSGYSVIVKKINLSVMSEEEMANHIQSEAEQYIPFDIDDVYLDFQDLKNLDEAEERTDVMLVAAKKDVVDGYLAMLEDIDLIPVLVDVDAFAIENAYGANFGTKETVGLIDIGASKISINIISSGSSAFARDVVMGSQQLTEQIQNRLHLEAADAEGVKIGQFSAEENQEELEEIFAGACSQWFAEIRKALDFFYSNYPDDSVTKLLVSGGGAKINGLGQMLTEEFDIPVEIFNPFAKLKVERSIDRDYLAYIAPEMALATGLASRKAEL